MNNFRIAIILPNLCGGGAERLHVNLANEWAAQGVDVKFILLRKEGELIALLAPEITVIGLNVNRIRSAIFLLAVHLRKNPSQVLLAAMWPLTSAAVIAWALSGRKGKLFLSDHENLSLTYIGQGLAKLSYLKNLIRFSYPLASGIIAVSRGVKKDLCELGNLRDKLVRVIYNPAATGVSSVRETYSVRVQLWGTGFDSHILSVGRLTVEKDHETMIKAFALLPKNLSAKLVILGEGPLRAKLEALITQLKLDGRVFLPGFIIDPSPWYRSADLFLLTSLREGFGNVIVEALECGLPVVSVNCPTGPSEILEDGRFGKLVPAKNPPALAIAIVESLESFHDHAELVCRAQDFSVRKISDEYLAYFFAK